MHPIYLIYTGNQGKLPKNQLSRILKMNVYTQRKEEGNFPHREKQSMQNPIAVMSRQIPGAWGQGSEKQRPRWEAKDLRDSKESNYWGLHGHFKDYGLFTFSKINNISLKFLSLVDVSWWVSLNIWLLQKAYITEENIRYEENSF